MSILRGRSTEDTYGDLLHVENAGQGFPLPASDNPTLAVEDGMGQKSPLHLGREKVNIQSGFQLGGSDVVATAAQVNALVAFLTTVNGGSTKIRLRGDVAANLPATLEPNEVYLATDTGRLYRGKADNSVVAVKIASADLTDKGLAGGVAELDGNARLPVSRLPDTAAKRDGTLQTGLNSEFVGGRKIWVEEDGVFNLAGGSDGDLLFEYTP